MMETTINAKTLRTELANIMERVRKGERFTVLYRSRPVCRVVPIDGGAVELGELTADPLFEAGPVGSSKDGLTAADHDRVLYGVRKT